MIHPLSSVFALAKMRPLSMLNSHFSVLAPSSLLELAVFPALSSNRTHFTKYPLASHHAPMTLPQGLMGALNQLCLRSFQACLVV